MKKIIIFQLFINLFFVQFSSAQKNPNVVFILAANYKTPNIDQSAKEGLQFNHCFTAPLCGQLPLAPSDFGFGIYWNTQEKGKYYTINGNVISLRDKEYAC